MTVIVDKLFRILGEAGAQRYGDENVSQLQHALQCAMLAERENAPAALVVAALLHDIGHLVDKIADGAARREIDRRHERIGSGYSPTGGANRRPRFCAGSAGAVSVHLQAMMW